MKRLLILLILGFSPALALAAEGATIPMASAHATVSNRGSLQRGAKYFVNYCAGCHELKYERFKRMATDLGIQKDTALKFLNFRKDAKYTSMMTNAMPDDKAAKWFGTTPPDLSVVARLRGADWIYNYLRGFYLDSSRPTGTNNLLLPNAAMPDVLWRMQGLQRAEFKTVTTDDGDTHQVFTGFKQVTDGVLSNAKFDRVVRDITNFLVYVGEPAKLHRYSIGWAVIIFLIVLGGIVYALKHEFWKDVHDDADSGDAK